MQLVIRKYVCYDRKFIIHLGTYTYYGSAYIRPHKGIYLAAIFMVNVFIYFLNYAMYQKHVPWTVRKYCSSPVALRKGTCK